MYNVHDMQALTCAVKCLSMCSACTANFQNALAKNAHEYFNRYFMKHTQQFGWSKETFFIFKTDTHAHAPAQSVK